MRCSSRCSCVFLPEISSNANISRRDCRNYSLFSVLILSHFIKSTMMQRTFCRRNIYFFSKKKTTIYLLQIQVNSLTTNVPTIYKSVNLQCFLTKIPYLTLQITSYSIPTGHYLFKPNNKKSRLIT